LSVTLLISSYITKQPIQTRAETKHT